MENECKYEIDEIKYLHSNLLTYVRNVKTFKSKVNSLEQISITEKATPSLDVHYKCHDKFKGSEYNIPSDEYVFDFIKDIKNEREIPKKIHSFLRRINEASKKMDIDFEIYE